MSVKIPVSAIAKLCNPFSADKHPWSKPITKEDVAKAIQENRLVSTPLISEDDDHAGRIAYLVLNEDTDAIQIDVGTPSIGYHGPHWPIIHGNHQLAAAIYAGREMIEGSVSGSVEHACTLFGIDCTESEIAA